MAINFPEGTQDLPAFLAQADNLNMTGTYSTNSTSWTGLTGFSNTIVNKKANPSILVIVSLGSLTGAGNTHALRLTRNGTTIAIGSPSGNHERHSFRVEGYNGTVNSSHCHGQTFIYLDTGFSAAVNSNITYSLDVRSEVGPFYVNRSGSDGNNNGVYNGRSHSSIILLEVAQ